jgi:CheY-like chemotaxis protein
MTAKLFNVLIADDSEVDRFLFKRAVKSVAPQLNVVGEFENGDEVIAYISGQAPYGDRALHPLPDLLVLDSRMPGKGGIEVLEWLRAHDFPSVKVAFFADSSATELKPRALALGASFFFAKAVRSDELLRVARTLQMELERGRDRKVVLRHRQTEAYYRGLCQWTLLPQEAMEFASFEKAAHYAQDQYLAPEVEVMLIFTETGQSFSFPFPEQPGAKTPDDSSGPW